MNKHTHTHTLTINITSIIPISNEKTKSNAKVFRGYKISGKILYNNFTVPAGIEKNLYIKFIIRNIFVTHFPIYSL